MVKRLVVYDKAEYRYAEICFDKQHYYLYGDNLAGFGTGGQAIIRGLSNAFGIPTKKAPRWDDGAFFTDKDFELAKEAIDLAFKRIPRDRQWVIPQAGLGTGRAQLPTRAPKIYAYLTSIIDALMQEEM